MDQPVVKVKKWYRRWWMYPVYFFLITIVLASMSGAREKGRMARENAEKTTPSESKAVESTTEAKTAEVPKQEVKAEPVVMDTKSKEDAQKELDEFLALAKKATLVTSYEFSEMANVIYVGQIWYSQTAIQKKDFLAFVSNLKEKATGFHRFQVKDAYSDETVAEVTAFSGALKIYK